MPLTLTRTVGFRAVHRLYRPDWSEAQNRAAFGALSDPPGHPHDYRCAVTVAGQAVPPMAMVLDLAELDRILEEEVVAPLDGKYLNTDVPTLTGTVTTCEALAQDVFRRLQRRLPPGVALQRVRIMEDPTLYADCTGLD